MTYLDNTGWIEQMRDERENAQKMKQMLGIKEGLDGYVPQSGDEQIYAVTAKYTAGPCFLALATGSQEDICAYFESQKGYGLDVSPVKCINVESGFAEKRRQLLIKQQELEVEIGIIKQELNSHLKDLK